MGDCGKQMVIRGPYENGPAHIKLNIVINHMPRISLKVFHHFVNRRQTRQTVRNAFELSVVIVWNVQNRYNADTTFVGLFLEICRSIFSQPLI